MTIQPVTTDITTPGIQNDQHPIIVIIPDSPEGLCDPIPEPPVTTPPRVVADPPLPRRTGNRGLTAARYSVVTVLASIAGYYALYPVAMIVGALLALVFVVAGVWYLVDRYSTPTYYTPERSEPTNPKVKKQQKLVRAAAKQRWVVDDRKTRKQTRLTTRAVRSAKPAKTTYIPPSQQSWVVPEEAQTSPPVDEPIRVDMVSKVTRAKKQTKAVKAAIKQATPWIVDKPIETPAAIEEIVRVDAISSIDAEVVKPPKQTKPKKTTQRPPRQPWITEWAVDEPPLVADRIIEPVRVDTVTPTAIPQPAIAKPTKPKRSVAKQPNNAPWTTIRPSPAIKVAPAEDELTRQWINVLRNPASEQARGVLTDEPAEGCTSHCAAGWLLEVNGGGFNTQSKNQMQRRYGASLLRKVAWMNDTKRVSLPKIADYIEQHHRS